MKSLDHEEAAFLRGDFAGHDYDGDRGEGARIVEIANRLILRGCVERYVESNNGQQTTYGHRVTALGRLASRVSLPTPPVQL